MTNADQTALREALTSKEYVWEEDAIVDKNGNWFLSVTFPNRMPDKDRNIIGEFFTSCLNKAV